MKYTIIAIVLIISSCTSDYPDKHVEQKHYDLDLTDGQFTITEYTIDDCQYIGYLTKGDGRYNYLTHKGNCTNPIHYQK